jgi:phosphate-selective porin
VKVLRPAGGIQHAGAVEEGAEAFARLPLSDQFRVTAGLFKTPFSAEFLTSRPDILFAERARVVNNIAPNRQPGVTVSSDLTEQLSATVGAFNGTRGLQPNDNDLFMYVGRLTGSTPVNIGQLEAGANVAYSIDDATALSNMGPPSVTSSFTGTRLLFGADARLNAEQWFVAGELNTAQLDPEGTTNTYSPFGFYLAGGVSVSDGHQVRARYDQYDPDNPVLPAPSDQVTLGYDYEPSSLLRVLINYQAPVDTLNEGFVTARLQVALR